MEKAELIRLYRAKRFIIQALELLHPTPEGQYLDIEIVEGDLPGEVRIKAAYYDRPKDEEEEEEGYPR